jgi:hypothetical protein
MAEFTRQLRQMRFDRVKKHEVQKKVILPSERANTALSDHAELI